MSIQKLFPTLIETGRLASAVRRKLNQQLRREIEILKSIDHEGRAWSRENYRGGYSSYSSLTKLHRTSPYFAELEKHINARVRRMVRELQWDLDGGRLEMTTCWVNEMPKGTYHTLHIHPHSVISGVYYVETPKHSSALKIEDPRLSKFMACPARVPDCKVENQHYIQIQPQDGEYVLFESWLRHEVPPNQSSRPRLSVSFNYEWLR